MKIYFLLTCPLFYYFRDQNGSNRNGGSSGAAQSSHQQPSNLAESFTVVLGSSHSKVTHNLRLVVSDPSEVFPSNRNKSERDAAIQAQTASSLYGKNLTGLVQLVNIRDWAKYKGGQVCHQGNAELHMFIKPKRYTDQVDAYTACTCFTKPNRAIQGLPDQHGAPL